MYKQHSTALKKGRTATYAAPLVSVYEVEIHGMMATSTTNTGGGHNPGGDGGEIIGAKGFEEDADPDNAWDF